MKRLRKGVCVRGIVSLDAQIAATVLRLDSGLVHDFLSHNQTTLLYACTFVFKAVSSHSAQYQGCLLFSEISLPPSGSFLVFFRHVRVACPDLQQI
ncbi:Hypothetical protein NTJ_14727 [Nesidiocoris tenuis]|uniref:Uncharacterized protein n=1 Tax=Nesidiocoris tenuis TaxID=355587 RepID=A0ABN7BC17_9HEMI|nr:Hypothetical protein NTJ_14727 [Nesidiocoris tenuis]